MYRCSTSTCSASRGKDKLTILEQNQGNRYGSIDVNDSQPHEGGCRQGLQSPYILDVGARGILCILPQRYECKEQQDSLQRR